MVQEPFIPSQYATLFFELLEASSDAVFIVRLEDGTIIDANDAFLSLVGFTRGEAVGHTTLSLGLWVHPSERQEYLTTLQEKGRVQRYPVRLRSRWSEEFTVLLSSVLVELRGDTVILGVGALTRRP